MADGQPFDVVVVGAGPAGCVLANRLTADGRTRVVLLEAGPDYGADRAMWPPELLDATGVATESHSWGYVNNDTGGSRAIPLPRARVVGGTSTVNGCIWMRGSAADYDEWAALGNPGWSFADVLPFFQRVESDLIGGPLHGLDGPVAVSRVGEAGLSEVDRGFVATARELGLPWRDDLNGDPVQTPAIGPAPKNLAGGVRLNGAFTYLEPARNRSNLTIQSDALVDRVAIVDGQATGVVLADGRRLHAREVVLAAGAYGSPAILLRSGIGPVEQLRRFEIPVVLDAPGVGEHLLDHPMTNDLMVAAIGEAFTPARTSFMPLAIKARSGRARSEIDLHIYQGQSFNEDIGRWIFWMSVSLEYARSRGYVRLTARAADAPLEIDHRHLTGDDDLEAFCDGIELAHELMRTYPLAAMVTPLPEYRPGWNDRDGLRGWARAHCGTTFHPSSTCRMGPATDPLAVVDHEARVHGVPGLRVVDASIFPTSPRANLHFTVVAVAEKIAAAMVDEFSMGRS